MLASLNERAVVLISMASCFLTGETVLAMVIGMAFVTPKRGPKTARKSGPQKLKAHCAPSAFVALFLVRKVAPFLGTRLDAFSNMRFWCSLRSGIRMWLYGFLNHAMRCKANPAHTCPLNCCLCESRTSLAQCSASFACCIIYQILYHLGTLLHGLPRGCVELAVMQESKIVGH